LEGTLEQLAANAQASGAHAIAVLGSVGGSAYMPRAMRKKVIATVARTTGGTIPLIAGVGAMTTAEVALNLNDAADAGAHGGLLQPVAYQPLLSHEVIGLYENASLATNIPLWVYNNPATTRHRFTIDELAHIASFDNVIGFKDRAANADEVQHRIEHIGSRLNERKRAQFNWGFSGENKGATMLGAGGHTWHSALAGVMPTVCVELAQAAVAGKSDEQVAAYAQKLQRALNPVTIMMAQYGGIRVAHAIGHERGLHMGALPQPLMQLPPAARGLLQLALNSVERSFEILHSGNEPEPVEALYVGSGNSRHSAGIGIGQYGNARTSRGAAPAPGPSPETGPSTVPTASPVRVSTRLTRTQNRDGAPLLAPARSVPAQTAASVDATQPAHQGLLLTGNPELDATVVNLERIVVPILGSEEALRTDSALATDAMQASGPGVQSEPEAPSSDESSHVLGHRRAQPVVEPETLGQDRAVPPQGWRSSGRAGDTPNYVPRRARKD